MNRETVVIEQLQHSVKMREKFFHHWSLLAAGIFSLLIPFVQSLQHIENTNLFICIELTLASVVALSSLRNYIGSILMWHYVRENIGHTDKMAKRKILGKLNQCIEFCAIAGLIVSIALAIVFLNDNIFHRKAAAVIQDCAWTKVEVAAKPAVQGVADEEAKKGLDQCLLGCDNTDDSLCAFNCQSTNRWESSWPAQDAYEYWRESTDEEYKNCLRQNGINE